MKDSIKKFVLPTGISWVDTSRQFQGDYVTLARKFFDDCCMWFSPTYCTNSQDKADIEKDADQYYPGKVEVISGSGQIAIWGWAGMTKEQQDETYLRYLKGKENHGSNV